MAFQIVVTVVWIPWSSGVRKATMAFHTLVTVVWIAVIAFPIKILMACQMVSNRYLNAVSNGSMVV